MHLVLLPTLLRLPHKIPPNITQIHHDMCPNLNVLCRRQYVRGNLGLLLSKFPSTILIAWLNVILRRYDDKDTHNLVHRKMASRIITYRALPNPEWSQCRCRNIIFSSPRSEPGRVGRVHGRAPSLQLSGTHDSGASILHKISRPCAVVDEHVPKEGPLRRTATLHPEHFSNDQALK